MNNVWMRIGGNIINMNEVVNIAKYEGYVTVYFKNKTHININVKLDEIWEKIGKGYQYNE